MLLGSLALPALAGKLYKIVDENGNVTFSQFPPKEKSENTTVEGVEVNSGGKAALREVGNRVYCGDMVVSYRSTSSSDRYAERRAESLREDVRYWQERLNRLERNASERSRDKLSSGGGYGISRTAERNSNYQEQMQEDIEEMRELRCALAWAQDSQSTQVTAATEGRSETSRLQDVRAGLERDMEQTCGREPLLDPTDSTNALKRRQWRACTKKFRKGLDDVDNELRYR
ncbi:hypothetical protein M5M_00980 [Simiduia agarivorans SA1 = DSM 21679]|uniref:DUF4124 domain-containing protein n=1 Tax=Simiduia agarivorans (strain DSM 21679 / JCM 13881 / BCRC 17597 / SA1) TaxID=1117647 RepID=K4KEF1_SIMAS|nr:hypothetical protein M5M_00980 [Simiduia agarivorans SA1 = DSM 21679]